MECTLAILPSSSIARVLEVKDSSLKKLKKLTADGGDWSGYTEKRRAGESDAFG